MWTAAKKLKQSPRRGATRRPLGSPWWRLIPPGQVVAALGFIGLLVGLQQFIATDPLPRWFPIQHIQVVAPFQHVALEDVQPLLLPQIDAGMFKFDAQDAESALQSLPWVYKARVRRIWPGTLQVELWEQKVVARWGSQGLLNPLGEVFVAQEDEGDTLPMLDGPENSSTRVWRAFRQCQEQLSMSDLRLTKLVVDRRGSWRATLSEGTEIRLGQGIPLAAIKIFLDKAFPVLREQMAGIAVVDVRYPNGFAVGRRAPDQQIDQTM